VTERLLPSPERLQQANFPHSGVLYLR
jgi:hypothetical protein